MLIRLPESWPEPAVAVVAMLVLAALDLAGSVAAKEAVVHRSALLGAFGAALFLALFWVYASSLQYAELAPLTFGWIVVLQVGLVLIDRYRYDIGLPLGKWVAVVIILAAQAYLICGPTAAAEARPPETPLGSTTAGAPPAAGR